MQDRDTTYQNPKYGLLLISLSTLLLEITMTKVFDVILTPNMSYMVISSAIFAFGLAGIFLSVYRLQTKNVPALLANLSIAFGVFTILLLPTLNFLPFDLDRITLEPVIQIISFSAMYLFLIIPFFISGLIIGSIFTHYSEEVQTLYFWDLVGAGFGCILFVPLIPLYGPGGLLCIIMGLSLIASVMFSLRNKKVQIGYPLLAAGIIALPVFHGNYLDFQGHHDKRGVLTAQKEGNVEYVKWDPVSKIDIVGIDEGKKHIAYDGGQQSSFYFRFNGDFDFLRDSIREEEYGKHYSRQGVLLSHYLKEGTAEDVLIIGSAGGQEVKAALQYGAKKIDAVELVGTVVNLGKGAYNEFIGGIYSGDRVNYFSGEGRSYLRSTRKKYDIIQIFSNHTSSSIAGGAASGATAYLQTAEAYAEYFNHLKRDGILHINHHYYPRMLTTAAAGWDLSGRGDFSKHVLIISKRDISPAFIETLATMVIKGTPWTEGDVDRAFRFFDSSRYEIVFHPLDPGSNIIPGEFLKIPFPVHLERMADYRIMPSTDDRPYFNFIRKKFHPIDGTRSRYIDWATLKILNSSLRKGFVPMDLIHLIVTGLVALFFAILFVILPLFLSQFGKTGWKGKYPSLIYFSCLGAGFIILELVFIQIFIKFIGSPVFTYVTVISSMLIAAGIGSLISGKLRLQEGKRWIFIFFPLLALGALFVAFYPRIFHHFLAKPMPVRIIASLVMIVPLGIFMGMPFPLGILALREREYGAIPWAWGMNGFFTVTGGLLSVILSIYVGFRISLIIALSIYLFAFAMYRKFQSV